MPLFTSLAFSLATGCMPFTMPPVTAQPQPQQFGWAIGDARPTTPAPSFHQVIQKVEQMPFDGDLVSRTQRRGLNIVNLMWEDTGRYEGSSVGPNISDLTLQVREQLAGGTSTHLLPVIRNPNFSDKTGDLPANKLWVRVGNQKSGGELNAVPLTEVLRNLREYMTNPNDLKGSDNFLAARDTHFLVSAQHVFLPLPATGKVEFNPVLYNYQSYPGSPAVLTLLVTREGTSIRVIENKPGDQSYQGWGQQLFFNKGGQRTAFTAERKSAVKARIEAQGETEEGDRGALEEGADMMMIVQVPLMQRQVRRAYEEGYGSLGGASMDKAPAAAAAPPAEMAERRRGAASDVEQAVLGHGQEMGAFTEIGGLALQRDARFPIRVTVQFYKATSNGVVSEQNLTDVADAINKVYANADYVGSLVVPEGEQNRPTSWIHHIVPRLFSEK
ncbi:MAG: hypothetical protein U1E65_20595 [Myxococcota bacterium]